MKQLIIFCILALCIAGCRKDIPVKSNDKTLVNLVYPALKDSLPDAIFKELDWRKIVHSNLNSVQESFIRIGFKDKVIENDFVLLKLTTHDKIEMGRIVHIRDGSIQYESLQGTRIERRMPTEYDPYIELPGVIVVSTYSSSGAIIWSNWYSFAEFLGGSYGATGYYGSVNPFVSGGSYSGGTTAAPYVVVNDKVIQVGFENQYANRAIDLQYYLDCFKNIPDAGASCKITIFADLPVNGDPTKLFNWSAGSPGHTWIKLEKSGTGGTIAQNIGFYPVSGWKTTLTPAPIKGKWVDNHHHEFNASFTVEITAAQLKTAITRILYLRNFVQYDIDDYNCTDWTLDVFNKTVTPDLALSIPRYKLPGGMAPNGTSTPQGLYTRLQQLKASGSSLAPNISIPLVGWTGASNGPCNLIF